MRIRSIGELDEFLDEELSRRKRELTTLKFMVRGNRPHEKAILLRAAVCILYAHWEGFVKKASSAYVSFVALRGLRYRDLSPSFLALALREEIAGATKATSRTSLMERVTLGLDGRAQIDWRQAVDTRSNLNSETLAEVFDVLGLDSSDYLVERHRLDQKLVAKRNGIAHGELVEIDMNDYTEMHELVLKLVERFRVDVANAAVTRDYCR